MSMEKDANRVGNPTFRVLVVDDERLFARAVARDLERHDMVVDLAYSAAQALARVQEASYAAILLDHKLPDDDGIRIIPALLARQLSASLIVMTAFEAIPHAIQAIRHGAEDYLVKQTRLQPIIDALLEVRRRRDVQQAGGWHEDAATLGLLGRSAPMVAVVEQLRRVGAGRDTTVLLTGETGCGKEVAARVLHAQSAPAGSPFIAVDCVAMPGPLVESHLFGHEKGAFTGADRARAGAFEEAGEGTLFLDEVGEMDLAVQGKLLRVLESRRYQRVGSVREHRVGARIVAATNRDLLERVEAGQFRFDLYQRLSVFPVHLPPLRERGQDVLILAGHFVDLFAKKMGVAPQPLSRDIRARLVAYEFPGNVRELKNVLERATILAAGGRIELHHLPERLLRIDAARSPSARPEGAMPIDFVPGVDTLESLERRLVMQALDQARGVKAEAARLLGISRFQLLRRLEKLRLPEGADGAPED